MFSPLVLIGLLITSLSLILNLKNSNSAIESFRKGKNIQKFINKIYTTIQVLIVLFILTLIKIYLSIPETFTIVHCYIYIAYILVYMCMILYVVMNLMSISFILKEIVFTSLKE
jgi:hypothetical protein